MTEYQSYRTMSWTTDRDECEAGCGTLMAEGRYVEGRWGHYCSSACRLDSESAGSTADEAQRRHERRQMGLTD